jgi:hypothetical protein
LHLNFLSLILCAENANLYQNLKNMMKIVARMMSLAVVAGALVFFASCGSDDPKPTDQQVQLDKLKKTWTIVTPIGAKLGDDNRTDEFPGFTLTISGNYNSSSPNTPSNATLTVGGGRPEIGPWPSTSGWEFVNISGNMGTIKRTIDDINITYSILTNGRLLLVFECPIGVCDYEPSRVKKVDGVWTFEMQ